MLGALGDKRGGKKNYLDSLLHSTPSANTRLVGTKINTYFCF
jgi:hypothetical protein